MHIVVPPPGGVRDRVFRPPADTGPGFVFMDGPGPLDLPCGSCGRVLLRGLRELLPVPHLLFECPGCAALNAICPPEPA
ncbi:hypothetical protein GIS00_14220 [Nakamurella sp. YIM 132087]|uniref:Uncharacterized protein n=1 Tax=Nakamurella alba TaxID=2665158 RepID=A0A7K1FLR9_9ACTN|nr:hypothetical protein [Nakamurella alba]MTD15095.1 hypothetical protein [Nakamurella alba]